MLYSVIVSENHIHQYEAESVEHAIALHRASPDNTGEELISVQPLKPEIDRDQLMQDMIDSAEQLEQLSNADLGKALKEYLTVVLVDTQSEGFTTSELIGAYVLIEDFSRALKHGLVR